MRRKIKIGLLVFVLLILVLLTLALSITMVPSDEELLENNTFTDTNTELDYLEIGHRKIRFLTTSVSEKRNLPLLVMVHGAPGGIGAFDKYLKDSLLRIHYNMLVYDRPGYGPSDATPMIGIFDQALILKELVLHHSNSSNSVVFLSHSFGGPIAALAAEQLDSLSTFHIMVAPVIDPVSEPMFWFSSLPLKWPLSLISSQELYISACEKMAHIEELEQLTSTWQECKTKTYHLHGAKDWLAPIANIKYVSDHFSSTILESEIIESGSHFILWDNKIFERIRMLLVNH